MEPRTWMGASVDRSVLRRLRRLDKRLRVTFSPYALDTFTGQLIICENAVDTEAGTVHNGPVVDPAHFLWRKPDGSHHVFVKSYPLLEGGFTHLSVLHLEGDLARHHTPAEAWRRVSNAAAKTAANKAKAHQNHLKDKVAANAGFGLRALRGEVNWQRDAKTFSYAGASSRLSGAERSIVRDKRELGIEE